MNKILVFGDIHGRTFWKEPSEKLITEVDKIIFLGDYLDSYPDEWDDKHTREDDIYNFLEIIHFKTKHKDKVILLLGNHDYHYISSLFNKECGGCRMDRENKNTIAQIFEEFKDYFQLAYEENINGKRIFFTHAGIMKSWYERNKDVIGELTANNINNLLNSNKGIKALAEVSYYRGGYYSTGSILWSDIRERFGPDSINEDELIDGIDLQVFGHTRLNNSPITCSAFACVDCKKPFVIDDNGKIKKLTQ